MRFDAVLGDLADPTHCILITGRSPGIAELLLLLTGTSVARAENYRLWLLSETFFDLSGSMRLNVHGEQVVQSHPE